MYSAYGAGLRMFGSRKSVKRVAGGPETVHKLQLVVPGSGVPDPAALERYAADPVALQRAVSALCDNSEPTPGFHEPLVGGEGWRELRPGVVAQRLPIASFRAAAAEIRDHVVGTYLPRKLAKYLGVKEVTADTVVQFPPDYGPDEGVPMPRGDKRQDDARRVRARLLRAVSPRAGMRCGRSAAVRVMGQLPPFPLVLTRRPHVSALLGFCWNRGFFAVPMRTYCGL